MKKMLRTLLLVMAVTFLAIGGVYNSESCAADGTFKKTSLRLSCDGMSDTSIDMHLAKRFAALVLEKTGGAVTIDIFGSNQLSSGSQQRAIEMLTGGTTEFGIYSNAITGSVLHEPLLAASIPFAFRDYQHIIDVYNATAGEYVNKSLNPSGLTYMGTIYNGFRNFSNSKRPIITPEDMKGLKIRVMQSEMYLDIFRTLGADPVGMSVSEVFTALQQGTIDGQDNGLTRSNDTRMFEVQKYYTVVNYSYDSFMLLANTKKLSALPQNLQDVLQQSADQACEETRKLFLEKESQYVQIFKDRGVAVVELTEEQKQLFRDVLQPVVKKYIEKYGLEACTAFGIK